VALTSGSEVVEGFSSVSWFLLSSLIALARPSFRAAIMLSQILAVLSIGASTALLARSCALLGLDRLFSTLTVIAFAAWGCSFSEAGNGMEMGLLAAACLLIINELLSPVPRLWLLSGGVVLAVTTRFEAVLYVALLGTGALALPDSASRRRAFRAIALSCLATVVVLSALRLVVFSDVLPNTFWAKRWAPYAAFSVQDRWVGAKELLRFFKVPLAALGIVVLSAFFTGLGLMRALGARRPALAILAAPILGAVVMGIVTGKHWGYIGRMPYFAFPPALLLLSLLFSTFVVAAKERLPAALAVGAAVLAVGSLLWAVRVSRIGYPHDWLAVARAGTFDVTPHSYAESGQVFRRLAAAAGLDRPVILTSDVGGLALCCDEFRIVDLAFLSSRQLAHEGPTAIGAVLDTESPDFVEAHWEWATVGKLYELPSFRARYAPAFAGGTRLWVRRDIGDRIARGGRGCWLPQEREDVRRALQADHGARFELPGDRASFQAPGIVLLLAHDDPDGVNLCPRLN
jgi:hypothetical protein